VTKEFEAAPVRIAPDPEAGQFGGRIGICYRSSRPSESGVSPLIGEARVDFALAVYFEDTGEQAWFAPHLVAPAPKDSDLGVSKA